MCERGREWVGRECVSEKGREVVSESVCVAGTWGLVHGAESHDEVLLAQLVEDPETDGARHVVLGHSFQHEGHVIVAAAERDRLQGGHAVRGPRGFQHQLAQRPLGARGWRCPHRHVQAALRAQLQAEDGDGARLQALGGIWTQRGALGVSSRLPTLYPAQDVLTVDHELPGDLPRRVQRLVLGATHQLLAVVVRGEGAGHVLEDGGEVGTRT